MKKGRYALIILDAVIFNVSPVTIDSVLTLIATFVTVLVCTVTF